MSYLQLKVGEKFDREMPDESMSIMLNNDAPILTFNFSVSEKNIHDFLNGVTSFGLFCEKNILFFLYKIDGFLAWSDLAFTTHLTDDETIEDDGSYLPFNLVLIESSTSIIKGIRVISVTPRFRSILAELIQLQRKDKFDTLAYYKNISVIYESYPKTFNMLAKSLVTEKGGMTVRE